MAIPVITPIANQASMTNARALVADIYGHLPSSRRDHPPYPMDAAGGHPGLPPSAGGCKGRMRRIGSSFIAGVR
jgi:hypothetical protein